MNRFAQPDVKETLDDERDNTPEIPHRAGRGGRDRLDGRRDGPPERNRQTAWRSSRVSWMKCS